jgi:hypothetical protein
MATQTLAQRPTVINPRRNVEMQRRHFQLIAEVISKELEGEHREKAAYAFAHILPITNRKFDSRKFLRACKVSAFAGGDNER